MYMLGIIISTDFYFNPFMKVCHFVKHDQEIYFKNEKTAVSEYWVRNTAQHCQFTIRETNEAIKKYCLFY